MTAAAMIISAMTEELDDYRRHVTEKIRNCDVREHPFAHAIVDGIFPEALYLQMLDERPPARQFERVQFGRKRLLLPGNANDYWRRLYAELFASCVTREVVNRFSAHIRPGVDVAGLVLRQCSLVLDGFGYEIPPHSDAPHKKVISLIFYMPRKDDRRQLGTCVLSPRAELARAGDYRWQSWKDFATVERIEFRPNRLFVFPVTERSFHAVPRIWRLTRRQSLQGFIA
jgi:hypothetical protein